MSLNLNLWRGLIYTCVKDFYIRCVSMPPLFVRRPILTLHSAHQGLDDTLPTRRQRSSRHERWRCFSPSTAVRPLRSATTHTDVWPQGATKYNFFERKSTWALTGIWAKTVGWCALTGWSRFFSKKIRFSRVWWVLMGKTGRIRDALTNLTIRLEPAQVDRKSLRFVMLWLLQTDREISD